MKIIKFANSVGTDKMAHNEPPYLDLHSLTSILRGGCRRVRVLGSFQCQGFGWLVGCFGFHGPLRQYFSLYWAVSQREGETGEKG